MMMMMMMKKKKKKGAQRRIDIQKLFVISRGQANKKNINSFVNSEVYIIITKNII